MEEAVWAKISVAHLLAVLPPRERIVLEERMHGATQQEAGEVIGVGKERVRQLELRAMERLRAALHHSNCRVRDATSDLVLRPVPGKPKPKGPTPREQGEMAKAREEQRLRDVIATYERRLAVLNARYPRPVSPGEAAYYRVDPPPPRYDIVLPQSGNLLDDLAEYARRYAEVYQ